MKKRKLSTALGLLGAFILWTAAISLIDLQPIGPHGSIVGFATINGWFHRFTGLHLWLYDLTDWLSLVPVAFGAGFALLGLRQWMTRKRLFKVDKSILALGVFYAVTLAAYLFFERFVINYRPVLISGILEASYPSSTTLLVLCIMPTAALELQRRIKQPLLRRWVCGAILTFTVFMVVARLVSGVHWLTDIIGGVLLSASLVMLYRYNT